LKLNVNIYWSYIKLMTMYLLHNEPTSLFK